MSDRIDLRCTHKNCAGKGTYELPVRCSNCGLTGTAEHTKGHEATDDRCPRCDTRNLRTILRWGTTSRSKA